MNRKFPFFLLLLALTALLAGCTGGYQTTGWPGVTVQEQTAYLAVGQHILAVNLETGIERWRFPEKADPNHSFYAAPSLTPDGQLLAGDYGKTLFSLNPETGAEVWRFEAATNRYIGSLLVTEQNIFAAVADGNLYALDFLGKPVWSKPFKANGALWSAPVADPECSCIYAASMDHHVYAIHPQTGEQLWKSGDVGGSIVGAPTLSPDGTLYVSTFGNEVKALNKKDGAFTGASFKAEGWIWGSPILLNDRIYIGDAKGNFFVLHAADLSLINQIKGTEPIVASPLVTEEMVVIVTVGTDATAGSIKAYTLDLQPLWTQTLPKGKIYSPPIIDSDVILITPSEGESFLLAYSLDGVQQWAFTPENK
jgi:outer membrane protein assembly factor BamB